MNHFAISQNLVLNSSFENKKHCTEFLGNFNNNATYWSTPNTGSTDYFHSCSQAVGFTNFFGIQTPKTGEAFAGLYVMAPEDYREYIQGNLSETLKKDQQYSISFYVSLAENSSHSIKDFGILFLKDTLKIASDKVLDINAILSTIPKSHFTLINSLNFYADKTQWEKVTFNYVAKGFEQVFVVGNFDKNKKIRSLEIKKTKHPDASYYYIDQVSVETIKEVSTENTTSKNIEEQDIKNNTVYTLKNVLFNFNKHNLIANSTFELDQLYQYLNSNKRLKIEIYGHTDEVGTETRNNQLSLLRAKEVALYLISKGLKPERITATGFGSKFPTSTNNTETGRALNRRVEFKLIEN